MQLDDPNSLMSLDKQPYPSTFSYCDPMVRLLTNRLMF